MAWIWKHWIPNWASSEVSATACTMLAGTDHEFYVAQNLVDDNPFKYCIFTPGSGTTVNFALSPVGQPAGVSHFGMINDDLPSDATIQLTGYGAGETLVLSPQSRGTDEIFIKSLGATYGHRNWQVGLANLTAYTWYRIGLLVFSLESEFSDQPTLPYIRRPVLEGHRHDNPAGRPFLYLNRNYWNWELTWKTAKRFFAITRTANYERIFTDKGFMIYDPVAAEYFFVRLSEAPTSQITRAEAGQWNYLYELTLNLQEAI